MYFKNGHCNEITSTELSIKQITRPENYTLTCIFSCARVFTMNYYQYQYSVKLSNINVTVIPMKYLIIYTNDRGSDNNLNM